MICLKRKVWGVTMVIVVITFIFNIFFLVDLSVNHQAHDHLIDSSLKDILLDGGIKDSLPDVKDSSPNLKDTPARDIKDGPPAGDIKDGPPAGDIKDGPPAGDIKDGPPAGDIKDGPPAGDIKDNSPGGDKKGKPPSGGKQVKKRRSKKGKPQKFYSLEVLSSQTEMVVKVRGKDVYKSEEHRGIHVVVLHQKTGNLMATRIFDTYLPGSEDQLVSFLNSITDGRILCLGILDEGTFSLKENGRNALDAIGSFLAYKISWRDMWGLVTVKGGEPLIEDMEKSLNIKTWGLPLSVLVSVPINEASTECDWPKTPENMRRLVFCSRYEGYGSLCHCAKPFPLYIHPPYELTPNYVSDVPVAVIASNRPSYLFRMLRRLLSTPGANPDMIMVFIDGFFQEPMDVAELLGVKAMQREPASQKNGRISQHYKNSLNSIFSSYPDANYVIILEEDLDVAVDFFSYFSQTFVLLQEDTSLYCISAWNDQGYEHTVQDPALLYRVETMPGLGWILKKDLFKVELEPNWPGPDKLWDWDMWMRLDSIRKGRECIIPDISRTFHFGASGLNMNPYFQDRYFKKHAINTAPDVTLANIHSVKKDNYEIVLHKLLRDGQTLDQTKDPCSEDFIPNTKGKVYVIYIQMKTSDNFDNWIKLASCFKVWDLGARGYHKGLWRLWLKGNHILVVGYPYSPYSSNYIPYGLTPYSFTTHPQPP